MIFPCLCYDIYCANENFLENNNDNHLFIIITIFHPRNRPWKPIGLFDVENPTLSTRQLDHRSEKLCIWGAEHSLYMKLSRQCGILNISEPCRPPGPVTGIALLFLFFTLAYFNPILYSCHDVHSCAHKVKYFDFLAQHS
jgi:hypothetical protein